MPAAATLDLPRARLNGSAHNDHHDHHPHASPHPPRPHVPDPALLIQQFADAGCAQSPLDLAREHGLTLDELIAFFDHPDTQRTLAGLDRLSLRRARSIAANALPQALQALTQITYLPTHGAPAATVEAVRKASTELARLGREHNDDTTHRADDEPPPPPPSIPSPHLPATPARRREANPRLSTLFEPADVFPFSPSPNSSVPSSDTPSPREGAGGGFPSSPTPSPSPPSKKIVRSRPTPPDLPSEPPP